MTPYFEYFPAAEAKFRGYVPLLFDMVAQEMGFSYEIVPVSVTVRPDEDIRAQLNGTYHLTPAAAQAASYSPELARLFVYSAPMYDATFSALVLKTGAEKGLWRLFGPFTPNLWLLVVSSVCVVAVLIVLVDALSPLQGSKSAKQAFTLSNASLSMYHAWAFVLGGEDYEWLTWAGRLLRLTFLFVTLILVSTYTANLAAFFTAPAFSVHGPKDMDELRSAKVCTTNADNGTDQVTRGDGNGDGDGAGEVPRIPLDPYVRAWIAPSMLDPNRQRYCHERLRDKTADAWVDDLSVLNEYFTRNCQDLALVESIRLLPNIYTFRIARSLWEFEANFSLALTHLRMQPIFIQMLRESFSFGISCAKQQDSDETAQVSVENMGGLFIIMAAGVLVSLIAGVVTRILQSCGHCKEGEESGQAPTSEGEMLKMVLERLADLQARGGRRAARADEYAGLPQSPITDLFPRAASPTAPDAGLICGPQAASSRRCSASGMERDPAPSEQTSYAG